MFFAWKTLSLHKSWKKWTSWYPSSRLTNSFHWRLLSTCYVLDTVMAFGWTKMSVSCFLSSSCPWLMGKGRPWNKQKTITWHDDVIFQGSEFWAKGAAWVKAWEFDKAWQIWENANKWWSKLFWEERSPRYAGSGRYWSWLTQKF